MRSVTLCLLLLVFSVVTVSAADRPAKQVAKDTDGPSSYTMITEGIVGGFVPAHVRQRTVLITRDGKHQLYVMKQPRRGEAATYHAGKLDDMQFRSLQDAITKLGLSKLPVESPAGCQDIYEQDTSIAFYADKNFWRNGGPGGCVRGVSKIQPKAEQKAVFRDAVALIKKTAENGAKAPADAKSFNDVVKEIQIHGSKRGKAAGKKASLSF